MTAKLDFDSRDGFFGNPVRTCGPERGYDDCGTIVTFSRLDATLSRENTIFKGMGEGMAIDTVLVNCINGLDRLGCLETS